MKEEDVADALFIQRQMIIEQACKWLRENFNQVLREFDDGEIVNKLFTEDIEERFKQAMTTSSPQP